MATPPRATITLCDVVEEGAQLRELLMRHGLTQSQVSDQSPLQEMEEPHQSHTVLLPSTGGR